MHKGGDNLMEKKRELHLQFCPSAGNYTCYLVKFPPLACMGVGGAKTLIGA